MVVALRTRTFSTNLQKKVLYYIKQQIRSKLSSDTLLSLLRTFMDQTLVEFFTCFSNHVVP